MYSNNDSRTVVGVFRSRPSAEACFNALVDRGHSTNDINLMMSEQTRARDYAWTELERGAAGAMVSEGSPARAARPDIAAKAREGTKAGNAAAEGMGLGGAMGTVVGASIAAIAAIGTSLVIPGLNLIVAGPIVAALAGGGAGAITGGIIGALVGMGITEQDAKVYNRALAEGGVVMSVIVPSSEQAEQVVNLMKANSGQQVASYSTEAVHA